MPLHGPILRELDEIARQGSIRKAARVLNVTSTSMNRRLIEAEEELGTQLFHRSPDGVELTEAGRIMVEHCRRALYDFARARSEIDDMRALRTGHLRIQSIDSLTFTLLPRAMVRFARANPGISLSMAVALPKDITNDLLSGECDIGISFTKEVHPDLRAHAERPTPFGIVMRPDHPLAERTRVSIEDLRGFRLVRTMDARGYTSIIDHEVSAAASTLTTTLFTNALMIAKQAILAGEAIGLYTKIGFVDEVAAGKLKFAQLDVPALASYKIGMLTPAAQGISPEKQLFIRAVETELRSVDLQN
ncbi:LysR family transcriptional regulator [Paracoccus pacificus]|uniref:LysR family transcriptional regulator n=1 Tax=Paracoccus pacificus TaxID=1463598 RepID=A0ABW4R6B6_9RHOB